MPSIGEIANECLVSSRWPAHHCVVDTGYNNPPWLQEGDSFFTWTERSGTLETGGLRIPLHTTWIMCPKHESLVTETMDPREVWLIRPTDLHYRGELAELGVRVTDAIEQEAQRNSQLH